MKSLEKIYRFHTENLRSVEAGLDAVLNSARVAIAQKREELVSTYVRIYGVLMGARTECRLAKLLYEPNKFSEVERRAVMKQTALDRWLTVVEIAFRRHYMIPTAELRPPAIPITEAARLRILREALSNDLRSVVVLRNKLAHGQWAYPLNEDGSDIAQEQFDALRKENILSLKQKTALVDYICDCIHDLVVSQPTFNRDFDDHFRCIEQIRINIERKSYHKWAELIQDRFSKGRLIKNGGPAETAANTLLPSTTA